MASQMFPSLPPSLACRLLTILMISFAAMPTRPLVATADTQVPTLESAFLRFQLSPVDGTYTILDKKGRTTWRSSPVQARFGEVTRKVGGQTPIAALGACQVTRSGSTLEATFHPLATDPAASVKVFVQMLKDRKTLEFAYEADPALAVESVRLLDDAFGVTDADKGYVVVPVREGLLIPADSGKTFTHRFNTYAYEGCHMAMFGVVKDVSAALFTWDDPYVALEIQRREPNGAAPGAKSLLTSTLVLRKSAKSFRVRFCGPGDYVTLAKAYREIAKAKGWWVPWSEKLKGHPERAKLFGAVNYKLWSTLSRTMNEESTQEKSVRVNWTFDEAAQVAEHLKKDLHLDRVLFTIGGWIRRGYDNQHPDILPAAPECGGDAAMADCSRRVRQLGYLFCLHDNYQDIYRDSPSWNEDTIMKNPDGSLMRGGHWAGGLAFLTCSPKALELARRPQNLPAVRELTEANSYFIDTTYAAGLQECFDPKHPLSLADDMKWKQALSDYARQVFGVFGSECGREWAIPHSDFFEGLTGVSGGAYHDAKLTDKVGGTVVPLFEIVYRDTIAMYGKYGYDNSQAADYVLQHLLLGRTLNHHNVPGHLYWKQPTSQDGSERPTNPKSLFVRADNGWGQHLHPFDRFVKNTAEILSPLNELTSQRPMTGHQFLSPDWKVQRSVFGQGKQAVQVVVNAGREDFVCRSEFGGEVILPQYGFLVESPDFIAFHASKWNGIEYRDPPLTTLRSLDGKPLTKSKKIRIYHGFGDPEVKLGQTVVGTSSEMEFSR